MSTTVAEKIEVLRLQGIDQSLALAMAADAQRREDLELDERKVASLTLSERAKKMAEYLPLGLKLDENELSSDNLPED